MIHYRSGYGFFGGPCGFSHGFPLLRWKHKSGTTEDSQGEGQPHGGDSSRHTEKRRAEQRDNKLPTSHNLTDDHQVRVVLLWTRFGAAGISGN